MIFYLFQKVITHRPARHLWPLWCLLWWHQSPEVSSSPTLTQILMLTCTLEAATRQLTINNISTTTLTVRLSLTLYKDFYTFTGINLICERWAPIMKCNSEKSDKENGKIDHVFLWYLETVWLHRCLSIPRFVPLGMLYFVGIFSINQDVIFWTSCQIK